jgi:hypothetical protein
MKCIENIRKLSSSSFGPLANGSVSESNDVFHLDHKKPQQMTIETLDFLEPLHVDE